MSSAAPELTQELTELAGAYGIATAYHDWRGEHRQVPVSTVVAVLAAMDVDASTPEAVRAAHSCAATDGGTGGGMGDGRARDG